jgi:hypothetical protein
LTIIETGDKIAPETNGQERRISFFLPVIIRGTELRRITAGRR